jgi:NADPH:quinone reductase-like Zn-dependent oxidoreductase
MTEERWDHTLRGSGFSGVDTEFRDFVSEECHEVSVLVSTATKAEPDDEIHQVWPHIIADVYNTSQAAQANSLMKEFRKLNTGCFITSLGGAVATPPKAGRTYIMLDGLDSKPIAQASENSYIALRTILTSASSLLWVTNGGGNVMADPDHGVAYGLARTVRSEYPALRLVNLALEQATECGTSTANIMRTYLHMMRSGSNVGYEQELMENEGMLHTNRIVECRQMNRKIVMEVTGRNNEPRQIGTAVPLKLPIPRLSEMDKPPRYEEDTLAGTPVQDDEIEIEVKAVGCSFRDTLSSLSRIDDSFMGLEVSGRVIQTGSLNRNIKVGDSVMALGLDTCRTIVRTKAQLAVPIPNDLSFIQGATMPLAFVTAYQALIESARLISTDAILITSAAGGVGQAAIQIAQHVGAEIYATVGSEEKKKFLEDNYSIQPDHVFHTHDKSFSSLLRQKSKTGVDVVFNSLSGYHRDASLECVAPYGRFVDIGQTEPGSMEGANLSLPKNTSYSSLDVVALIRDRPATIRLALEGVVELLAGKHIRPLDTTVFKPSTIYEALKLLSSGSSCGKVVMEMDSNDVVEVWSRKSHER